MNYLTSFFWVITIVFFALSIVHFIKVMKNNKDGTKNVNITKAIAYLSGAILLAILLTFKPFDTTKLARVLKRKPQVSTETAATIITTSLSGPSVTSVSV